MSFYVVRNAINNLFLFLFLFLNVKFTYSISECDTQCSELVRNRNIVDLGNAYVPCLLIDRMYFQIFVFACLLISLYCYKFIFVFRSIKFIIYNEFDTMAK